ncbi:ParB N-terminal domain-containing protein [Sinirhodobacter sp. HNIBRBA609]|nr:ParB N-terminal domain-containing protein [Sinirhodobacter sp. HNIBRBA609]
MTDKLTTQNPLYTRVALSELDIRPDDFQFRDTPLDQYHADEILKALQQGRDVGPMDVWRDPDDGKLYVLDGHHRFDAYTRLKWSEPVKVQVHEGAFHRVKLVALRENTKARLPMSAQERANAAWGLAQEQSDDGGFTYSKRELAEATGVSERTVATMRSTHRKLIEIGKEPPRRWSTAIEMAKGKEFGEMTEEELEEWNEAKAAEFDRHVGKFIAEYSKRYPVAVRIVLERRMGQEFEYMIDYCAKAADDIDDNKPPF